MYYKYFDETDTLVPTMMDGSNLYMDEHPFAYWVGNNVCEWILYKEYNDNPTGVAMGGLSGISYEDLMDRFLTFPWFKDEEREMLCRTFRQRSLEDEHGDYFEDFVEDTPDTKPEKDTCPILKKESTPIIDYVAFRGSRNLKDRNIHTTEYLFILKK